MIGRARVESARELPVHPITCGPGRGTASGCGLGSDPISQM